MEDRLLMEGLLFDTKVMADLCLHGAIESSTEEVHKQFSTALKDVLSMQHEIYTIMSNEGWYQMNQICYFNGRKLISSFFYFFFT